MQHEQRDAAYLWDMLDAARTVEQLSSNQDFTQYSNDRRTHRRYGDGGFVGETRCCMETIQTIVMHNR